MSSLLVVVVHVVAVLLMEAGCNTDATEKAKKLLPNEIDIPLPTPWNSAVKARGYHNVTVTLHSDSPDMKKLSVVFHQIDLVFDSPDCGITSTVIDFEINVRIPLGGKPENPSSCVKELRLNDKCIHPLFVWLWNDYMNGKNVKQKVADLFSHFTLPHLDFTKLL